MVKYSIKQCVMMCALSVPFMWPVAAGAQNTVFADYLGSNVKREQVHVVQALANNAVELSDGRVIYLIGILPLELPRSSSLHRNADAMYTNDALNPTYTIAEQAMLFMRDELDDQDIELEFDVETVNSDGQRMAYVWIGERLINAEILQAGLAHLTTRPPNLKYVDQLRKAYRRASAAQIGIHLN